MITIGFKEFMLLGFLFFLMNSIAEFFANIVFELFKKLKDKNQYVDTETCLHK